MRKYRSEKLIVHLAAGAENTDDLPRKSWKQANAARESPVASQCQQIALLTRR